MRWKPTDELTSNPGVNSRIEAGLNREGSLSDGTAGDAAVAFIISLALALERRTYCPGREE